MKITEIRIHHVRTGKGNLKAFVSITIDNSLVITDLKIISAGKGFFVAMPSKKVGESEYRDIVFPLTTEAREMLQGQILRAYEDEMSQPGIKPEKF